jgi:hypothetical protein
MADGSDDEVAALAARADLARSRMVEALSALDRRRSEVMNEDLPAARAALRIAGVLAVAAIAGAVVVRAVAAGVRRRRARRLRFHWRLARIGPAPDPAPSLLRKLVAAAVMELARAAVARFVDHLSAGAAPRDEAQRERALAAAGRA